MSPKVGRNAPCWCGSGKKYKRCHLGRNLEDPVPLSEVDKKFREAFSQRMCLVPNVMKNQCSGQIVKAHTVSRAACLSKIARYGHVYQIKVGLFGSDLPDGPAAYDLVGMNQASTFSGFCSHHDGTIFRIIDTEEFKATAEQCFLLAYRAVSYEVFTKISAMDLLSSSGDLDSGREVSEQVRIQNLFSWMQSGTSQGLTDINSHKAKFDEMLLEKDFAALRYYVINLQTPPDIMCASGYFPIYDFSGQQVQELGVPDKVPDVIFFSSIASESKGAVVFSWHKDSDKACMPFISSLDHLTDGELPHALVRWFFDTSENLYLSPDWFESLREPDQQSLIRRINVAGDPFKPFDSKSLLDDGVRAVKWAVTGRQSNLG
ncbi:MAG: SEC-C domain-containing protein [Chloroflexi bacterium]|nr:SEC-C domain-containing protein [Chloroflexota bacterium]